MKQNPTPQRNEPIISDAIFGVDIDVVEIQPRQTFDANFFKLPDLAAEVYANYQPDVKQLDRTLAREELSYYSAGLL